MRSKGTSSKEGRQEPPNDGSRLIPSNNHRDQLRTSQPSAPINHLPKEDLGTYDTVRITERGFTQDQILDLDSWDVRHQGDHLKDASTIIYIKSDGSHSQYGERGECVTVGLKYQANDGRKGWGGGLVSVNVPSPSALLHGRNTLKVLTPEDIPVFQDALQAIISDYIDAEVGGMSVSRLDSATRYLTETRTSLIIDTLAAISRNKVGRSTKELYAGQNVKFKNRSTSFGIYDSSAKYGYTWDVDDQPNYTRVESQAVRSGAVRSMYGIGIQVSKGRYAPLAFNDIGKDEVIAQAVIRRLNDFDNYFPMPRRSDEDQYKDIIQTFVSAFEYWMDEEKKAVSNGEHRFYDLHARAALTTLSKLGISKDFHLAIAQDAGMDKHRKHRLSKKLDEQIVHTVKVKDIHQEIRNHIENDQKLIA